MVIMKDGFSTIISFSLDSAVLFEEKEVTPFGIDGGGENDTSTMRNTSLRTKAPKGLYSATEISVTVAYDPATLTEIIAMVNQNQEITITFPDTSTWVAWGWFNEFAPGANVEGEQPTADITIICSNRNDSDVETAPVYSAP